MTAERLADPNAGFTLIEIITTIVILGILSAITASFFKPAIDSYVDVANRAALSEKADSAVRQLTRELQTALPNSLRSTSSGSTSCIEFLPVIAGGRYRIQPDSAGAGDVLDFSTTDTSFDVLAEEGLSSLFPSSSTYRVAIYNLGQANADAYNGDVTAAIKSASSTNIKLSAGKQFPFASPSNRFFVIPDNSVAYTCRGSGIFRSTQNIVATPPETCPTEGTLLVDNVSACSIVYTPSVDRRNGLVAIRLQLTQNNETVTLYQEVPINNVP